MVQMELKDTKMRGTKTEANLIGHWKAKSVQKAKIQIYQKKAGRDARHISAILGELATYQYVHAAHAYRVLWGPYEDVENNMEKLIAQEREHMRAFPEYAKVAREEGFEEVAEAFELMAKVDADQEKKLVDILDKIRADSIFNKESEQSWYCQQCGNVHRGVSAPESCALCKAAQRFFEIKGANFATF